MAKQGMKRRAEENSKRLGLLLKAIIAANVWPAISTHIALSRAPAVPEP